jgi:hypothetical protein
MVDTGDAPGVSGGGGVDDDVRARLAKAIASTSRWFASSSDG